MKMATRAPDRHGEQHHRQASSDTDAVSLMMLHDSNATVANFFSFHGFRGFLHENENDMFLRLHILDCGHAVTCMYTKSDEGVSPYGNERCRLPLSAGRALCVAFQSLYYLADDSNTCPEDLRKEVYTFAEHCLCTDHVKRTNAVQDVADRLLLAVKRWQCRRVFMDEPDGPPSTPPEERIGTSRLSQLFIRPVNRSPRRRPHFRTRLVDSELEYDSWGLLHERRSRAQGRRSSIVDMSSSQHTQRKHESLTSNTQASSSNGTTDVNSSHYQQLKGRAIGVVGRFVKNTD